MTKRINWAKILIQIKELKELLNDQNYCIDLSYKFYSTIKPNISHRPEINSAVISAYWSKEFLEHDKLNSYPLDPNAIYIETEYYSYLNLLELRDVAYRLGESIYIVDLMVDTTDIKSGQDIEDWLDDNDDFQNNMQELWDDEILSIWQGENKLITKKNTIDFRHYWKNEEYIYQMRVYDSAGKPKLVILLGTYADYL